MARPDIRANSAEVYHDATGIEILFGFQAEDRFIVAYTIQKPSGNLITIDELTKVGNEYRLRVRDAKPGLDHTIINIFTGLFATEQGDVSILITP